MNGESRNPEDAGNGWLGVFAVWANSAVVETKVLRMRNETTEEGEVMEGEREPNYGLTVDHDIWCSSDWYYQDGWRVTLDEVAAMDDAERIENEREPTPDA